MSEENSGLHCSYYDVRVEHTYYFERTPYTAECGEIMEALGLNIYEVYIFKEIWRQANARKGLKKKGNSNIRGAEKILWNAQRLYDIAKREENDRLVQSRNKSLQEQHYRDRLRQNKGPDTRNQETPLGVDD